MRNVITGRGSAHVQKTGPGSALPYELASAVGLVRVAQRRSA